MKSRTFKMNRRCLIVKTTGGNYAAIPVTSIICIRQLDTEPGGKPRLSIFISTDNMGAPVEIEIGQPFEAVMRAYTKARSPFFVRRNIKASDYDYE